MHVQLGEIPPARWLNSAVASAAGTKPSANPVVAVARELHEHHRTQWEAEDESRDSAADSESLAAIKRRIDGMNVTRSALIDEIDEWAARHVPQRADAPLHTETLGSVVDRLCIASVRAAKLRSKAADAADGDALARSELAERQLRELGVAYDTVVREVGNGRRRFPDWRLLKSYGQA